MLAAHSIKQRIDETVEKLPLGSLWELSTFLDFLAFKYHLSDSRPVVVLGGLWKDVPLDVTDDDVRALQPRSHPSQECRE